MGEVTQLADIASHVSGFGWVAIFIYFLYKDGTLSKLIGRVAEDTPPATPPWATKLMTYVNHDQTEKIDKVLASVDSLAVSLNKFLNSIDDKLIVPINRMVQKHEEWEKYGIPTQCIDDNK